MVYPRENGLVTLTKFVAVCALSASSFLGTQASQNAAMATCTTTTSPGDAAVGIKIISDANCAAGGLGCIDSVCRFCKERETPQSAHLLSCATLLPTPAPATTTTAVPGATTAAPATVTTAPATTTAAPATCAALGGDIAVGIQAIPDGSCSAGGLGCFNNGCRFCKYSETPKSTHLLACSSFGYNYPTLAPVPMPTGSTGACAISEGDLAVGIRAITDATCLTGGLGCYSDHCRYCKEVVTPQSAHLGECSSYTTTTTAPATAAPATIAPATTAPTSSVPVVTTTPAPATAEPTFAPVEVNTTCTIDDETAALDLGIVLDAAVTADDTDFASAGCRYCKLAETSGLETFALCSLFPNYVAPTTAPTVCTTTVSAGDASVGIQIVTDTSCAAGGLGCIDSVCRYCKLSTTPQSAHLTDCAIVVDPSAAATATPGTVAPAPVTVAPTTCETPVSAGDAAVGINIVSDTTCATGGVGCIDSICRFCKVTTTPQSAHLIACPTGTTPAVTVAPVPTAPSPVTVAPTMCSTPVSEGDAAVGINIVTDATCAAGGVGCIDSICRFCKVSTTPQSAHLDDCSAHTPAPTTEEPLFDPNDITGTTCTLADEFKVLGVDVVLDATVTDVDADYFIAGCRFCKTFDSTESASFTACSSFSGYGSTATTAPTTTAPTTTAPTTSFPSTIAPSGACTQVVSEGDAAVGIQITSDATCAAGGVGCIDSICRFCKTSTTPQSAHLVDCSSIVATTAPAVTTAAPGTTTAPDTTTTPDTTTAPVTTTAPDTTTAPVTTGLCATSVTEGDAAVGIQVISDVTCASGGLGCFTDVCRYCKVSTTLQSAHLGDCSSYTVSTATTAPATVAPATVAPATTTAPSTTTAPATATAPATYSPGSCASVSAGDAAVGINIISDASCVNGGVGCIDTACRFCKVFITLQSAHLGDCSSFTGTAATTAPATTTAATTTDATTAAATTAPAATMTATTTPAAASTTCNTVASEGDSAAGLNIVTDATCLTSGGAGCVDRSACKFCKVFETEVSATYPWCDGYAPAPTTAAPASSDATAAAITIACDGQTISEGDFAGGVVFSYDPTNCPAGTTVGCVGDVGCKFCKEFNSDVSSHLDFCPGYPIATVTSSPPVLNALRVQASADDTKSSETSLSAEFSKLFNNNGAAMYVAVAAACVGSIAVIALVVVGSMRASRRLRRGSSSEFEEEEEEEEEGSVLTAVTEDNATATGVSAEEADASLSGKV